METMQVTGSNPEIRIVPLPAEIEELERWLADDMLNGFGDTRSALAPK